MDPHLTGCVTAVIEQLDYIQRQLSSPETDAQSRLAVPKLSLAEVRRLKATVDRIRIFLWAYLDAWSDGDVNTRLRQIRIESAADMLGLIDQDFRTRGVPQTTQAKRLCQQIQAMRDLAGPPAAS